MKLNTLVSDCCADKRAFACDCWLIAVAAEEMKVTPGLAGRIFTAISKRNVNI